MTKPLVLVKRVWLTFAGNLKMPRRIIAGILRGTWMQLDLNSDCQTLLGIAEWELQSSVRRFSKNLKTAIDVGTSQGYYTLFFLAKTAAKRVFGFDPDTHCVNRLYRNLELNHLQTDSRFKFSQKFVGNSDDENTISLDSLLKEIETPCLIKVDVEGAEVEVFKGARKLLETPGVRWIVETHSRQLEKECIRLLNSYGLKTKIIDKAWWRSILPELRPGTHNRWLTATH